MATVVSHATFLEVRARRQRVVAALAQPEIGVFSSTGSTPPAETECDPEAAPPWSDLRHAMRLALPVDF